MTTPSTQSGGAQYEQHARWREAHKRLTRGPVPPPELTPDRPRPVSPFAPERQCQPAPALASAPPHRLFAAPIIELDENGRPVEPELLPAWRRITREVCRKHGVTMGDLISPRRSYYIVSARHELFWRLYEETSMSLPQIGRRFNRDHTSVMHGVKSHQRKVREAQAN